MRRLSLLTVAALLLVSVDGWAQSCDGCGIGYRHPAGLTGLTSSGTAITSTLPIQIPNGAAAEYGELAWASNTFLVRTVTNGGSSRGISLISASTNVDIIDGTLTSRFNFSTNAANGFRIDSARPFGWTPGAANASGPDLVMVREAAATLQLGLDAATATAQTIVAADSTGASQPGAQLNLSGGTGGAGGEPGAVAIVDGGTKPTCAEAIRGSIWYDAGGAGVLDTFEVCRKDASNNYAWVSLF